VRVGKSSVDFNIVAASKGAPRLTVCSTLVRTDLERGTSEPWPPQLARKLRAT